MVKGWRDKYRHALGRDWGAIVAFYNKPSLVCENVPWLFWRWLHAYLYAIWAKRWSAPPAAAAKASRGWGASCWAWNALRADESEEKNRLGFIRGAIQVYTLYGSIQQYVILVFLAVSFYYIFVFFHRLVDFLLLVFLVLMLFASGAFHPPLSFLFLGTSLSRKCGPVCSLFFSKYCITRGFSGKCVGHNQLSRGSVALLFLLCFQKHGMLPRRETQTPSCMQSSWNIIFCQATGRLYLIFLWWHRHVFCTLYRVSWGRQNRKLYMSKIARSIHSLQHCNTAILLLFVVWY